MALVESARDVRLDRHAEPAQGDGHDRQAGQAIGVEVAEHQDALASVARRAQPAEEEVRVGQSVRVVEAVERVGEPGGDVVAGQGAAAGEQAGHPGRQTQAGGRGEGGR